MRDRIWAETKIIEAARRDGRDPQLSSSLLFVAQYQIQRFTEELQVLEARNPEFRLLFECYREIRVITYPKSHLLHLIQPFLSTYRFSLPDYRYFEQGVNLMKVV
jgi:hypothetical protein